MAAVIHNPIARDSLLLKAALWSAAAEDEAVKPDDDEAAAH
jgi:hypothetical protein